MRVNTLEETYPYIIAGLMTYIDKIKCKDFDKEYALIDIIMDYANNEDLDVELVGDAIRSDMYFMSFIKKDCLTRHIILADKDPAQTIDEW